MPQVVLPFETLTIKDQHMAGGKGGMLARLYRAGYPVPHGFIILPGAFEGDELRLEAWSQTQRQLRQMRKKEEEIRFAVRSSALNEDSVHASFAGEFETILNVVSDEEIRSAIHTVRRSRRSGRVKAYSEAKGMDANHEIAVVVQRMVQADFSGILFTADPVSGSRAAMQGSYLPGLGDRLVSGAETGESFSLERPQGDFRGPDELKQYAGKIYKLAGRLEKELGCPQDIEWALAGGKLFLLQSRPITTLQGYNQETGEWNDSLTGDYLWSNVNFGEAVSEAMTPLAWSAVHSLLSGWVFIPGFPMVGSIAGRPYLNISIPATLFRALGRSRRDLLSSLEATLYMRLPEEMEIPYMTLSPKELLSSLVCSMRVQQNQRRGLKLLGDYLENNPAWFRQIRHRIRETESRNSLVALWEKEIKPHLHQGVWCVLGSATYSADYTLRLRRDLTELAGPEDADHLIANLSSQRDGLLASMGPVVGLEKVARAEMSREVYLEQYGHRGPNEFELSAPRPAEDPGWFDRELSNYRNSPVNVSALLEKQREKSEAAYQRLKARHSWKVKAITSRIAESGRRARLRELARSEYVRDRWLIRLFALRAGEISGLGEDIFYLMLPEIPEALTGGREVIQRIPKRKETHLRYRSLPPIPSLIRGRFDPFKWAADPQRKIDIFDAQAGYPRAAAAQNAANLITGSPGSAGRVEGNVRVLNHPAEGDKLLPGEILAAVQTDIAWTLLFPRASGVITDVGAPLSHAAIIARELGIPAVVGCGNATQRLKTGDRVRLDGGRGIVEIIEPVG